MSPTMHIFMSVPSSWYPNLPAKYVQYLNMRRLSIFLFVVYVGATVGSASSVPVISEFDPDQLQIFTGSEDVNSYFHYISFDPEYRSRIYIGAVDFVYRLNANNISFDVRRSENITSTTGYQLMLQYSLATCREPFASKPNPDYQCRSHIRAILPIDDRELYICATGYYNPQDFYLDRETLKVVAVVSNANPDDPAGSGSGVSKCPPDPDSPYTILHVGQASPRLLPAIYSTLSISSGYDPAIYRSSLKANRTSPVELYQMRSQLFTNPDVTFVATYEIDQFVYFFYREMAVEVSSYGTIRYSRVARVCKNDVGGSVDPNKFLTFVKARLVCSVSSGSDIPIYYNELYDVQYDATENVFYGLFRMNQNSSWGSAVCRFSYKSISDKFEKDEFLSQDTPNSPWQITPDQQVPKPRLCLCQTNITASLPTATQIFGLTHYLMAGTIEPMDDGPLHYKQDVGYSHLVVDVVQRSGQNFTVFFLFSEKRPEEIVRVVQWSTNGIVSSKQFSVLKPFPETKSRLWNMVLHKPSDKTWLYVVKDAAVFQLSTVLCSRYKLCTDCVTDPYCGWNSTSHVCLPYTTGLLQNVKSLSSLTACNDVCKISTVHPHPFIPGLAVHFNCASHCSPEGSVRWLWSESSSSASKPLNESYILTQDSGLVILNFTSNLAGILKCVSNNVTLAEHTIKASCCNYSGDICTTLINEYKMWCDAFSEYRKEYNKWICSKKQNGTSTTSALNKDYCSKN